MINESAGERKLKAATGKIDRRSEEKRTGVWWEKKSAALDPETIKEMMPKSKEQFVGNEYFIG